MSSSCRSAALLFLWLCAVGAPASAWELRVCADLNNLPFSNERLEGFENKLVDIIAQELHATVTYTWWAQRRGFLRNTLNADQCDLVPGTPTKLGMLQTTTPYYRSSYVFVTPPGAPEITSLDDPRLHSLRIGVHLIGDNGF
ncbi:MAG TPA: quinoprotein dehydrogenase-associated putative ABC transporter substrate-binding protein, partial [Beijerinckiaceae bacterium]|nr:quinoprotein dehydrogenase-associated putative ABC transporter substrate-binding protein [Beijerinckiaceae bacterium]